MKPLARFPAIIATALLVSFPCGCSQPNDSETNTRATETGHPDGSNAGEAYGLGLNLSPFAAALASRTGDVNEARAEARKKQTILLPRGSFYEGEAVDGNKPDGRGRLVAPNGTDQYGEWRYGQAYKLTGTWVAADGTKEVGAWNLDGTKSGGTIRWPDGRTYEGEWLNVANKADSPNGTGVMMWPDGRTYTGQFRNGEMDGLGKMTWPDGKVDVGSWHHGKFVGAKP